MSPLMTICWRAVWTSTTGDSPVTVIDSASAPHSHVRANRHDATARQLDAFAHDSGEAGQREGDLVGAGWQIRNAILPRFVGDAGADLGDERRARRFNRDTREHGTRCVAHGSGEALRGRQTGSRAEESHHHQQSDQHSIHEREPPQMPRLRGLWPLRTASVKEGPEWSPGFQEASPSRSIRRRAP